LSAVQHRILAVILQDVVQDIARFLGQRLIFA
jgi:hypothetical protein